MSDQQAMQQYVRQQLVQQQQASNLSPVGPANYNPPFPTRYDVPPVETADVGGEKPVPVFSNKQRVVEALHNVRRDARAAWDEAINQNMPAQEQARRYENFRAAEDQYLSGLANPDINPVMNTKLRRDALVGPATEDAGVIQDAINARKQRGRGP